MTTTAAPTAVSRNNGNVDVIVRGTDDGVSQHLQRHGWGGWGQIPGRMKTQHAPAATMRTLNTMDIFARAPDGGVRWASWDGAAWSGWKTIPGGVDSAPAVVADTAQRIWLFARRGADVIYNVYDAGKGAENGWNGWKSMHPPPPPPPAPPACDPVRAAVTGHAKVVGFGRSPHLSGRARRIDGGPLVSAQIIVRPPTAAGSRPRSRAPTAPTMRHARPARAAR